MINFVAFTSRHDLENTTFGAPWFAVTDKSAFESNFSSWEPEVQALMDVRISTSSFLFDHWSEAHILTHQCVDKPFQWAIHTVKPMRSFVYGRVALLGDAVSLIVSRI